MPNRDPQGLIDRYRPNFNREHCGVCNEVPNHIVEGFILSEHYLEVWCPACFFTAYPWKDSVLGEYKRKVKTRETQEIIEEFIKGKTFIPTEDIYPRLLNGDDDGE